MPDYHVHVVSTPLQLISCTEARRSSPEGRSLLVIARADNARTRTQLAYLMQRLGWNDSEIISLDKRFFYFTAASLVRRLRSAGVGRLVIGNLGSWIHELFYRSIPAREVVFVDDGAATIGYYTGALGRGGRITGMKRAYFRRAGLPLDIKLQEPLNFFTFFPLDDRPDIRVVRHDFPAFRAAFPPRARAGSAGAVVGFLGQCNSTSQELARLVVQLKQVIARHPGHRIVYFMHRKEREGQLRAALAGMPIEIRAPAWPIEVEVSESEYGFIAIYSFISTALFTLKLMYPDMRVYRIDDRTLAASLRHHDAISGVYRAAGIETVSIDAHTGARDR